MWLILQQETPEDFVLATGEMHTVREFVEKSFAITGVQIRFVYETLLCMLSMVENLFYRWEGKGEQEKGIDAATGKVRVQIDPRYFRPAEVE